MSQRGYAATAVKIIHPQLESKGRQGILHLLEAPPRSRLYGLTPREVETIWRESLTSYLNRLGWRHGVSPRALAAQEIVPHLSHDYPHHHLAAFSRGNALGMNGNGSTALEWPTILERLTMRSDLHLLTLRWWIGDLPARGHLREAPSWCPACYTEWRAQNLPIYQPLIWLFRVVTVCSKHQLRLEERCPHCLKKQSVIALDMLPGHCTQCQRWLGTSPDAVPEQPLDKATLDHQAWVMHALEELRVACFPSGTLAWHQFFASLATCLQQRGAGTRLAELTGLDRGVFYLWLGRMRRASDYAPSLEAIFECCYACDVTPLQAMTFPDAFLRALDREPASRPLRTPRLRHPSVDRQRCLELIQAVLDGREEPLGLPQLARRLGRHKSVLLYYFPQDCALVVKQAQEYRRQRRERRVNGVCEEVRQAVMTLHAQGIFPSHEKVRELLSNPHLLRIPEAAATWHVTRRELGLEPSPLGAQK